MPRRIVTVDAFHRSVAALGDAPEVASVVKELVLRAMNRPEDGSIVPARPSLRTLASRSYARLPALRLFYRFDDETLHLLLVEPYDELL
jgi:hypothetical protein